MQSVAIAVILLSLIALLFYIGRSLFVGASQVRPQQKPTDADPTPDHLALWAAQMGDAAAQPHNHHDSHPLASSPSPHASGEAVHHAFPDHSHHHDTSSPSPDSGSFDGGSHSHN